MRLCGGSQRERSSPTGRWRFWPEAPEAEGRLAPEFAFGGPEEQRRLLEGEGVVVSEDGYVDMKTYCVEF